MKYAVQVNYRTHRGNASSRTFVVEANSEPEAVEIANGKARKHPNVQSIVGGDVVEVFSPAPTDWGKEFSKIQDLRGKAMQYIAQMVDKHGSIKLPDPLWLAEDDKHTQWGEYSEAFICLDMDGLYITEPDDTDKDMMLIYLEDSIVIEIAAMVQKAIAGGTGK